MQANNHPLASLLAWAAQRVATTEAGLRAPFLLLGALAAPALAWSVAQALEPATGRLAGGLAALAPLHVTYAQQVRGYAGLLLAASLLVGLVPRALGGRGGRRDALGIAACGALGVWSHATLLVPLAGWTALALAAPRLGLADPAGRRTALRGLLGGLAGGLVLMAPLVDDLLKHARRTLGRDAGRLEPGSLRVVDLLELPGGLAASARPPGAVLALALLALASVGALHRLLGRQRSSPASTPTVACLLVPVAGALGLVVLGAPAYARLALFALPAVLALAAVGLRAVPSRPARVGLVACVLLASAWLVGERARAPLQDYRGAARVARELAGPGGRVIGAGVGGALVRAYDAAVRADEGDGGWTLVDAALDEDVPFVVVVPFPAWTPAALRARLDERSTPVLLPGDVTPVAVWATR